MKRTLIVAIALLALSSASLAANLEREVKSRWLGAWVLTSVESWSDCGGLYTNNRVNGNLVKSRGDFRFQPGELAKVNRINVKRHRLDLLLSLNEPLLVAYHEGPFTLYREAWCKVELQVEIPREIVKAKDADAVEDLLVRVLERHATERAALDSRNWNGRERDPYPEDYERTLAELAVWRANRVNEGVQAKLDYALEETTRLAYRVSSDPAYLEGFARGVEAARSESLRDCPVLLALDLGGPPRRQARGHSPDETAEQRADRGFRDGRALVQGLEMLERLPVCFVPVPPLPDDHVASNQ
jgi:hypothetical protein